MTKRTATMDGNEAAAYIAYRFSEIAAIYPITPSSPMAEKTDVWSSEGRLNMFDQPVTLVEMQSEAGAIAAVHGALQTGALAVTFTSSQGLMLMIPVLHRIAGELLPGVLHVASRTVGTHALSIFGDHSDVMNCRQTGFAMLATGSVQEIIDLGGIAHLAAVKGRIPFIHFFDGFRTSHELNKVELLPSGSLEALLDHEALDDFRSRSLNPERPKLRSTVQNDDVYFQVREASQPFYDALPGIVADYMAQIGEITGRQYRLFDYYGDPNATDVVIAMGSVSGTIRETVDALCRSGRKVGFIQVRLFRPFAVDYFLEVLPPSVRRITVLDRCKEMGSAGEPLFQDVCTVLADAGHDLVVLGGRYGLSSKDTTPSQIVAVYDNMCNAQPIQSFSVGIVDDVNETSLAVIDRPEIGDEGIVSCKFWGLGGDGTVGANQNTVKIINEQTDLYGQAYFQYDAKKSFGVTKSHLRFGKQPIRGAYYVRQADILACHHESYINQFDIVSEIKPGGTLLLNCSWEPDEAEAMLCADVRRELARKNINVYSIHATAIAQEIGLGRHISTVLQAAFFSLVDVIPLETALDEMKKAARETFFAKGEDIIAKNIAAIEAGATAVRRIDVPASWTDAKESANRAIRVRSAFRMLSHAFCSRLTRRRATICPSAHSSVMRTAQSTSV